MKKLLTLVVVLLIASTSFAQNMTARNTEEVSKKNIELKKAGDNVRAHNNILFDKREKLGALKSDKAQIPHGPHDNDVMLFEEDFEDDIGFYGFDLTGSDGTADTTTFNAFQGEGGEYSWWIGTNDPTYLQPGYGADWYVGIQHVKTSYQLQSGLSSATINFDAFYNLEEGWDGVHLMVSTDSGSTWNWVECWSGDSGGEWIQNVSVDISDFIGEWITFRFMLISDGGYDSEDGEVGSFNNPGGFFVDNLEIRRNGVPELITDGGDTKYNMFEVGYSVPWVWNYSGAEYNSSDTSMAHIGGVPGEVTAFATGDEVDLTLAGIGGNYATPIWLDFYIYSTIPYSSSDPAFIYWWPMAVNWTAMEFEFLTASVYVGPFGADGDFEAYSDNFGYIDISYLIGNELSLGMLYAAPGGCDLGTGELYVDDFEVIQKNDPWEYNDYCDTAGAIEYGFVSEFTNLFDASDVDWFHFDGEEGDWVDLYAIGDTELDLELLSGTDNETCVDWMSTGLPCCPIYSYDYGSLYSRVIWRLPYTGDYFISVSSPAGDTSAYVMYLDKLQADAEITSIVDRPDDQGGFVKLTFNAPELDNGEDDDFGRWGAKTQGFQVERKVSIISSNYDEVLQWEAFGLATDDDPTYTLDVPTKADSSSNTFRIRTKTGEVQILGRDYTTVGGTASGMSYDNIAPAFVEQYTLSPESGEGIDIAAVVDYGGLIDESDIAFYNIYRAEESGFTPSAANKIATIETSSESIRYNDVEYDGSVQFYYVIEVIDDGGNKAFSDEVNTITSVENEAVPTVYSLAQNYPNPFNPATTIKFGIPQAADVTIKIYDILGQEVQTLVNRNLSAGFHTVNFNASNLISGMYIYRIQANGVDGSNFTDVKKMLLVK